MVDTPQIRVTADGPYVVTGGVPLRRKRHLRTGQDEQLAWQTDPPLSTEDRYALCRCGRSQAKPFCDGSHATAPWDSAETAPTGRYAERAKDYPAGDDVVVHDDRSICEHAAFCTTAQTNVWKLTRQGEQTDVQSQVVAMVERCPSGALTWSAGGRPVEPDLRTGIGVVDDGPLFVTGAVPVTRADGAPFEARNRMTLCRCGASKNKPLCDGSHAEVGFRDSPERAAPGRAPS